MLKQNSFNLHFQQLSQLVREHAGELSDFQFELAHSIFCPIQINIASIVSVCARFFFLCRRIFAPIVCHVCDDRTSNININRCCCCCWWFRCAYYLRFLCNDPWSYHRKSISVKFFWFCFVSIFCFSFSFLSSISYVVKCWCEYDIYKGNRIFCSTGWLLCLILAI